MRGLAIAAGVFAILTLVGFRELLNALRLL